MAQWNTNVKHEPSSINNGNQYEKKDRFSREMLNALAENSFYAVKKSEEAIEKANSAFEANGTLVTIKGKNQTTWSADFVEDERQKTLNLCCLKSGSHSNYGVSAVYNAETQTITLTGTATTDVDIMYNSRNILSNISNMADKTVTVSFYVVSGSYSGNFRSFLGTYDNSNIWSDRFQVANFENGDLTTHYEGVHIPNNLTYDTLMIYCHSGVTFNNLVLKVQFVEGEAQDEWRYPYGAIVHANEVYPVGSIYMSVNQTSPASFFGGTWEQLTADAYLKIVTSNGGSLGGTSSEHKIPTSSMPAHRHSLQLASTSGGDWSYVLNSASVDKNKSAELSGGFTGSTDMRGGGEAYYPYYYGVYVWKRVG